MMENKCNKTPNKYLDHLYCQPGESKNYMRSNNNPPGGGAGTGGDVLALLKENKQLKAMLILHLDLIQEQSDQLITKDKQMCSLKEELQAVRAKNIQLENTLQDFQRQVQRKRSSAPLGELSLLSPPPLAKIQCKKDSNSTSPTNIIGECNGKLISKIVLQKINLPDGTVIDTHSPNSTNTISDMVSEEAPRDLQSELKDHDKEDLEDLTTEESNDANLALMSKEHPDVIGTSPSSTASLTGAKPHSLGTVNNSTMPTTTLQCNAPVQICVTPPTPSRGKQMPLMLWHAPNMNSEDSGSCDETTADLEQQKSAEGLQTFQTKSETPGAAKKKTRKASQQVQGRQQNQRQIQNPQQFHQKHKRRCVYMTTSQMYATREWEDEDEAVCDYEFSQAEAEALHAEAPMLEIPKWTEHELNPLYCIEGTEDLSDESFMKRHAKLEIDEKRRKKWDVQQIREQRRIEKLKRRHCKNEVQNTEQLTLKSFYPQPDSIQSICFINELPVQAFGEMVPKISNSGDFILPWLQTESSVTIPTITSPKTNITTNPPTPAIATTNSSVEIIANSMPSCTSTQTHPQLIKSSFVFLKKRKRQQSSSAGGTTRQRTSAASKGTQQTLTMPTTVLLSNKNTTEMTVAPEDTTNKLTK